MISRQNYINICQRKKRLTLSHAWVRLMVLFATVAFCACGGWKEPAAHVDNPAPIFPDYKEVTVPLNIAPPDFGIPRARRVQVILNAGGEQVRLSGDDHVEIAPADWERIKSAALKASNGGVGRVDVRVQAWTEARPDGEEYPKFRLFVSPDSIDPYICYRLIPPGYESWNTMGIYQRELHTFRETPIVTNRQNSYGCVNCHSLSAYSPEKGFLFHARGAGGGTVVYKDGRLKKVALETLGPQKGGTYPMWHPGGRWVVFSSNVTRQSFYAHSLDKIEVYDTGSDLILYDALTDRVLSDPRFSDPLHWETFPAFSPDGRWLYFCQAKPVRMPTEFQNLHYSLLRVPFDPDTGALGARVDTIYSAFRRGGSVSFPRISPDGRWLLYTWSQCGTFPIHHKEADLRMIDLHSPTFEELKDIGPINSPDVDSYHSWSSSGRWVIFSSKRVDGRFTRLFLAHWDGRRFSKPMLLPQRDPAHNRWRMYSYNIPEFMLSTVSFSREDMARLLSPDAD